MNESAHWNYMRSGRRRKNKFLLTKKRSWMDIKPTTWIWGISVSSLNFNETTSWPSLLQRKVTKENRNSMKMKRTFNCHFGSSFNCHLMNWFLETSHTEIVFWRVETWQRSWENAPANSGSWLAPVNSPTVTEVTFTQHWSYLKILRFLF